MNMRQSRPIVLAAIGVLIALIGVFIPGNTGTLVAAIGAGLGLVSVGMVL